MSQRKNKSETNAYVTPLLSWLPLFQLFCSNSNGKKRGLPSNFLFIWHFSTPPIDCQNENWQFLSKAVTIQSKAPVTWTMNSRGISVAQIQCCTHMCEAASLNAQILDIVSARDGNIIPSQVPPHLTVIWSLKFKNNNAARSLFLFRLFNKKLGHKMS